MEKPGLAVGWDVGGWLGSKQAVAVIRLGADGTWRYVGRPRRFSLRELGDRAMIDLVRKGWPDAPRDAVETHRVVLAIDAPLAFPEAFQRLLGGAPHDLPAPEREIDSPLAYRACDRHVHERYRKKPLSPSFDKLGNAATVAMVTSRRFRDLERFRIRPFDARTDGEREIIEVYPALLKRQGLVVPRVRALVPDDLPDRSDEGDAAICALMALAHLRPPDPRIPALEGPPPEDGCATREGWIYAPGPEWGEAG